MVFKDPRFAAKNYQMRGTHLDHTPRHKFMWWVRFVRTTDEAESDPNSRWPTGISFKAHTVDRPRFVIKNQTLNSYNKKRVIQSALEYQPITMKFYDTYDDVTLKFMKDYLQFYYADFSQADSTAWRHDQTDAEMEMGIGSWGFYNGTTDTPDSSYFFDRVEIYSFGAGKYTRWDLVHPKIVEISPDAFDYSDGGTPAEMTITLAYEGVIWPEIGEAFTDNEDTGEMMALDEGEYGDDFNSSSKLVFVTEDFGTTEVPATTTTTTNGTSTTNGTGGSSNNLLNNLFRPPLPTKSNPFSSILNGLSLNNIGSVGSQLGLNFGHGAAGQSSFLPSANMFSGSKFNRGDLSSISSLMGSNSGLMSQISSMGSSLLGRVGGGNSGIGSLFSGFFSDDTLTLQERKTLAQPVTQTQYAEYVVILNLAMDALSKVKSTINVQSSTISLRQALDDIQSLADSAGLIFVGETLLSQLGARLERLMKALGTINSYLRGFSSSGGASHAAYEVARGRMQKLGIYDRSLATIVADEIMKDNGVAGYNTTDFTTNTLDPSVFAKINTKMGSEAQLGMMNPILTKPGLNPAQRSLRHQLDRSPTYLKQLNLYMENGIAPTLVEGDLDE